MYLEYVLGTEETILGIRFPFMNYFLKYLQHNRVIQVCIASGTAIAILISIALVFLKVGQTLSLVVFFQY